MKKILIILPFLYFSISCQILQNKKRFALRILAASNLQAAKITNSKHFSGDVVLYTPRHVSDSLTITDQPVAGIEKYHYLVADVWHTNPYCAILYFDFYASDVSGDLSAQGAEKPCQRKDRPSIFFKIGVLPYLKTTVVIPLAYLDGQNVFLPRYGRQLKGFVAGNRTRPAAVEHITLRIEPFMQPAYTPSIEIGAVYLTKKAPNCSGYTSPVVDCYGQWKAREWPGKTYSDQDLANLFSSTLQTFHKPDTSQISPYGGWLKKKFTATGYFRTQHDGRRWWLVDPDGYAFISNGCDCIRPGTPALIAGREELFDTLPPVDHPLYASCYSFKRGLSYDFVSSNFIRIYGSQWRNEWNSYTLNIFNASGFNTLGNWSDSAFIVYAKKPYVITLKSFPSTKTKLFRDFPDVFSPEYKEQSIRFAKQLHKLKDDKYLIGYFLQNEPQWAFGEFNLAFEMLKTKTQSATRQELVQWLTRRYGTVEKLNTAWKTRFPSIGYLASHALEIIPSEQARTDLLEFSNRMVDIYVDIVTAEVKKIDPHHLNLGMRYAWISSALCYRAGKNFDVFSINGYSYPGPPQTHEIYQRTGKPVIIGEFHFGATDRGLPANGIQGAKSTADRGRAYRYYIENGYARPELVGIHYFQWYDQPVTGRFDGENYGIGILDICSRPYSDMLEYFIQSHNNLYPVASGTLNPYDTIVEKVPQIYF